MNSTPPLRQRGHAKTSRIPIKIAPAPLLPKPDWIRVRAPSAAAGERFQAVKTLLRERSLHTVCEEATCPNIGECFGSGTATFMILGDLCTRRCPFCDVAHGKPAPPDAEEPGRLAEAVSSLALNYVVITSVDRDDLRDGGAAQFAACVRALRDAAPGVRIEILTPDFRKSLETALELLAADPPDVMNHNLETVPRLYKAVRPGADYAHSLALLQRLRERCPAVPTKSGLMLGLGERDEEVIEVMQDLRRAGVERLTIGQYLAPSGAHLPVLRYAAPEVFTHLRTEAARLGFTHYSIAPLVRSSYHAERQGE